MSNPDPKTSKLESSIKAFKYEQQIIMLQKILQSCKNVTTREDIRKLNDLIDKYQSLEKE